MNHDSYHHWNHCFHIMSNSLCGYVDLEMRIPDMPFEVAKAHLKRNMPSMCPGTLISIILKAVAAASMVGSSVGVMVPTQATREDEASSKFGWNRSWYQPVSCDSSSKNAALSFSCEGLKRSSTFPKAAKNWMRSEMVSLPVLLSSSCTDSKVTPHTWDMAL